MTPVAERQPPKPPKSESNEVQDLGPGQLVERSEQEQAVIEASRSNSRLDAKQVQLATEWFLSEDEEPPTVLAFDVDVAPSGRPAHYVRWQVRALQRHEIKKIRQDAVDPDTGIEDDMEVNMRVLIAASVEPNFLELVKQTKYADPADLVSRRFAHKPGIIEAIARKANEMSGYGSVQIIKPVDAAGN